MKLYKTLAYLRKAGTKEIVGPFSSKEIDELRVSGELSKYSHWVWYKTDEGWSRIPDNSVASDSHTTPLNNPVAPRAPIKTQAESTFQPNESDFEPIIEQQAQKSSRSSISRLSHSSSTASRSYTQSPQKYEIVESIRAICHNRKVILTGDISEPRRSGCFLVSADQLIPIVSKGTTLQMNLLDVTTGRSESVEVIVKEIEKVENGLSYRLDWRTTPVLLRESR